MGWDYYTYMAQPAFFIVEIVESMIAEDKVKEIRESSSNK
jgi:hypothetical protein